MTTTQSYRSCSFHYPPPAPGLAVDNSSMDAIRNFFRTKADRSTKSSKARKHQFVLVPGQERSEPVSRGQGIPSFSAPRNQAAMGGNSNPFSSTTPPTRRPASGTGSGNVNDPPPAYTPPTVAPTTNVAASCSDDDKFAFLSTFDTVFLVDDSGSMAGGPWRETAAALQSITPVCTAHDADGIDIHFLNHGANDPSLYRNIASPERVQQIFRTVTPMGGTPTGIRLHHILKPYLQRYKVDPIGTKPLNIVVITDGVPSDDVESVIISAAKQLDRADAPAWQVGIQFFQVGSEPGAAAALQELDDGLAEVAGGIRDMVDTVPWRGTGSSGGQALNGDELLKVVLGSVNRRLDRKRI